MGYVITGFLVIVAFMTSAATFSAFLFYAIGETATGNEELFTPATYQPMEMLTRHAATETAASNVHVAVA